MRLRRDERARRRAAIDAAIETSGRLDIMFNNAGVATPRPGMVFEDHTDDDWDRLMGINLRGVFYGMKQAVITFKAQGDGGVIVNTGSVAGMVGWGGTVYGATKGGVIQLTRGVAMEVAPHNIRVNCICPAGMPTTNFSVEHELRGDREPRGGVASARTDHHARGLRGGGAVPRVRRSRQSHGRRSPGRRWVHRAVTTPVFVRADSERATTPRENETLVEAQPRCTVAGAPLWSTRSAWKAAPRGLPSVHVSLP